MTITSNYKEYKDDYGQIYFVEKYWDKHTPNRTYWRYGTKAISGKFILKDKLLSRPNMKNLFGAK